MHMEPKKTPDVQNNTNNVGLLIQTSIYILELNSAPTCSLVNRDPKGWGVRIEKDKRHKRWRQDRILIKSRLLEE